MKGFKIIATLLASIVSGWLITLVATWHACIFFGPKIYGSDFLSQGHFFVSFIILTATPTLGTALGTLSYFLPKLNKFVTLPIGFIAGLYILIPISLLKIDRPHEYSLEITGTIGAKIKCEITEDSKKKELISTIPLKLTLNGTDIKIKSAIIKSKPDDYIALKIIGPKEPIITKSNKEYLPQNPGFKITIKAFGYSNKYGYTNSGGGTMWDKEFNEFTQ